MPKFNKATLFFFVGGPNPWPFPGSGQLIQKQTNSPPQGGTLGATVADVRAAGGHRLCFSMAFVSVPFVEAYPQPLRVQERRLLETVHRFLFFLGGTWAVHESACRWWFWPATADRYSWTSSKLGESWRLQYILFGKLPLPRSVLFKPAKMEFQLKWCCKLIDNRYFEGERSQVWSALGLRFFLERLSCCMIIPF